MYDASLPWQIGLILSGLGTVGTLLFAGVALERLVKEKNEKGILRASLAIGFVFVAFVVPIWYRVYIQWGIYSLIVLVGFTTIPLGGIAIGRAKGFVIASYCLAGVYMMYAIVTVIKAVV